MNDPASFFTKDLQLGPLKLPNNIFYAPLAGCSDFPFRQMSAKWRPGLIYCEMVKMDALIRYDPGTFHLLDYSPNMHPIGAQLCGSKPQIAAKAAKIIEDLGFDVLDLNCGCPVDKITKDGSGSGLLKNPNLIGDIIANIVAAVKIPVTIKIRAGWDESSIVAPLLTRIAEQAGAKAICIHGRTRQQAYKGAANWEWITQAKLAANTIKVIGNGDLFSPKAVENMFRTTNCDAVLIARGTLGHPWIVEDAIRHLQGLPPIPRPLSFCREALMEHFNHTLQYHHNHKAAVDMRRVGCWYLKKSSGTRSFREQISRASDIDVIRNLIRDFPLDDLECLENYPDQVYDEAE